MAASYLFRSSIFLPQSWFFTNDRTSHPRARASCTIQTVEVLFWPSTSLLYPTSNLVQMWYLAGQSSKVLTAIILAALVVFLSQISNSRSDFHQTRESAHDWANRLY